MKLYVNGDSHTAAAEAVCPHAFAEDDGALYHLGRRPHPSNLAVSWGQQLAHQLRASFYCDAESASSNQRIMRTTREWLASNSDQQGQLIIIQWSTWEREEWLIDGTWYQITASGDDQVPPAYRDRYREFVMSVDWDRCTVRWHQEIWQLHCDLESLGIPHVFFNGNNHLGAIAPDQRHTWGSAYYHPYCDQNTWHMWLKNNGFDTVTPENWHFGPKAHAAWANHMLQYIVQNQLI